MFGFLLNMIICLEIYGNHRYKLLLIQSHFALPQLLTIWHRGTVARIPLETNCEIWFAISVFKGETTRIIYVMFTLVFETPCLWLVICSKIQDDLHAHIFKQYYAHIQDKSNIFNTIHLQVFNTIYMHIFNTQYIWTYSTEFLCTYSTQYMHIFNTQYTCTYSTQSICTYSTRIM